jgi:hypothetical protein
VVRYTFFHDYADQCTTGAQQALLLRLGPQIQTLLSRKGRRRGGGRTCRSRRSRGGCSIVRGDRAGSHPRTKTSDAPALERDNFSWLRPAHADATEGWWQLSSLPQGAAAYAFEAGSFFAGAARAHFGHSSSDGRHDRNSHRRRTRCNGSAAGTCHCISWGCCSWSVRSVGRSSIRGGPCLTNCRCRRWTKRPPPSAPPQCERALNLLGSVFIAPTPGSRCLVRSAFDRTTARYEIANSELSIEKQPARVGPLDDLSWLLSTHNSEFIIPQRSGSRRSRCRPRIQPASRPPRQTPVRVPSPPARSGHRQTTDRRS